MLSLSSSDFYALNGKINQLVRYLSAFFVGAQFVWFNFFIIVSLLIRKTMYKIPTLGGFFMYLVSLIVKSLTGKHHIYPLL